MNLCTQRRRIKLNDRIEGHARNNRKRLQTKYSARYTTESKQTFRVPTLTRQHANIDNTTEYGKNATQ